MRLWQIQTLIVNVFVTLAFAIYGGYTAWEQVTHKREEIIRDISDIAKTIAAGSADNLLTASYDRLESHLLRQAMLASILELAISDADGRVLALVSKNDRGEPIPVYSIRQIDDWLLTGESKDESRYTLHVEVRLGSLLGYVHIVASLQRLADVRKHIWIDTLKAAAIAVLLLSLIQGLFLRRVGRGLEDTAAFAEQLIFHRGEVVTDSSKIVEIRQLKRALTRISQDLASQHQELSESEARKTAILEASLDCHVIIDIDGNIVEFNRAAEDVFGFSRDEVLGASLSAMIIPHQLRSAHNKGFDHYKKTGEGPVIGQRIELPAIRKDGSKLDVELSIVPFKAHDKRFFLGAMRDITSRKALEKERNVAERQLRSALADLDARETVLDKHAMVCVTDPDGKIVYANDQFCSVTGYEMEEVVGNDRRLVQPDQTHPDLVEAMRSSVRRGQAWHGELAHLKKCGDLYWVMTTVAPVLNEQHQPRQYITISTDITDQKLATQEAKDAHARELNLGFEIQQTLLFGKLPHRIGDASLSAHVEPSAGIDGDFYDLFPVESGVFDLAVGDVMGKGISAALIGAGVKQKLALASMAQLARGHTPEKVVNQLHQSIFDNLVAVESFVTFAYFRFDTLHRRITFVDAGHTKAVFANGLGSARFLEGENMPLGVDKSEVYRHHTVAWSPGDYVMLYSDGLTEAMNADGQMFGSERPRKMLQDLAMQRVPAGIVTQAIRKALRDYLNGQKPSDDMTTLVVALDPPSRILREIRMPWDYRQIQLVREAITQSASQIGLTDDKAMSLVLAASETLANIIRHNPQDATFGEIDVRISRQEKGLEVLFHYLGDTFDTDVPPPDFSGQSDGGFGLYIVKQSVEQVDYTQLVHGVFRIRLWQPYPSARRRFTS